jgi:hypothetical protein
MTTLDQTSTPAVSTDSLLSTFSPDRTTPTSPQGKRTCLQRGHYHRWESRGRTDGGGARCFYCPVCTAWGWASWVRPSRIRQYASPFKSRMPPAEPTVLTSAERKANEGTASSESVDRRADRPRRNKGDYTPRFGLDDWDREPARGGRGR